MVQILASENIPLDMTAKPSDYFYFTGDIWYAKRTSTSVLFEYETFYGKQCMVYYKGTNLLNNRQKITELNIGYPEEGSWIIDYTDLDGRFDNYELLNMVLDGFNKGAMLDGNDYIEGGYHDDIITGKKGRDFLFGYGGDDIIWAGNGRDEITGGSGADTMYGGFGPNNFWDLDDGYRDTIYLQSDQFAYNWFYGKAGNSPTGKKKDFLAGIEKHDRVIIRGVPTSALVVEEFGDFIEVRAYGVVEAVFADHSLSISQAARIVSGDQG